MPRRRAHTTRPRSEDLVPARGRIGLRRLVTLAVLVGFVAMHGVSADHDAHVLAALSGSSHASGHAHHAGTGHATVDPTVDTVTAAGPQADVRQAPAQGADGHAHACLLALTVGALAFVLALLAGGAVSSRTRLLSRGGGSLLSRAPPRPSRPCLFALGVLRT